MGCINGADGGPAPVAQDLVAYLVIEVPDVAALTSLAAPLRDLVNSSLIRILDVVVVRKDADGVVDAVELDDVEGVDVLRAARTDVGDLLSEHDIRLATLAMRAGSAGIVLVTEDRWAAELSAAAHVVGGRIVAGERIAASRVERACGAADERGGG